MRAGPCAALLTLALFASGADAPSRFAAVYETARPSVVTIESLNASGEEIAQGSGFIANGKVITNLHVVKGAVSVRITSFGGDTAEPHHDNWRKPAELLITVSEGDHQRS